MKMVSQILCPTAHVRLGILDVTCYNAEVGFSPYRGNIQAARFGCKAGSHFFVLALTIVAKAGILF